MSGDSGNCYRMEENFIYVDNEKTPALANNEGFDIRPLDPEIFGEKAAKESKKKQNIKK